MTEDAQPVLILAGPTASGKSALALALAGEFDGVVINADSMQVYRELRILTARPTPQDEERAPHRLYGVLSAAERCSAGSWRGMALAEIAAAHDAGRLPIVCGGTGLYLKALAGGLSPMPIIPASVRERLTARLAVDGAAVLHAELASRDPDIAARLDSNDSQRIVRALEVLEATGQSLAAWQAGPAEPPARNLRFATILLAPPREALYSACEKRLAAMLTAGALDEVRQLNAMALNPSLPAMKAVGVREFSEYLAGNCDLPAALAAARQATRRYAKRQMTWFRHQIVADMLITEQFSESFLPKTFSFIRHKLLTTTV
ncbi:MAG: tRNA (adenosine(37)-N6)-dimethylallyltransferase MiaA [Alphaproteobacteria bacterium]|nr:tRNA (adenosine(37)-N6)-dimethylallyltransferase MiaA [Alphaproteobacteria bacterium]